MPLNRLHRFVQSPNVVLDGPTEFRPKIHRTESGRRGQRRFSPINPHTQRTFKRNLW